MNVDVLVQQAANTALPASMGAMDIDDDMPAIRPRFRRSALVDSPILQLYDILGKYNHTYVCPLGRIFRSAGNGY